MDENLQIGKDEINVLVYANHNEIYFFALSIVREGMMTIRKADRTIILQVELSNSLYEHIIIPENIKIVHVSITSNELNYQKILRM